MDIFIINTSDANNISEDLLKQFEHQKFSNIAKWKEHCLSYLMLDRILKEVYKIPNRDIEFINKKPYLKNKHIYFSISHSNEYIAISFSKSDCGIDIEEIKKRSYTNISKRMNFNSNSLEEFYYDWTKYEADYKLSSNAESYKQFQYKNYIITAASINPQEIFEVYIQNGEKFPNL